MEEAGAELGCSTSPAALSEAKSTVSGGGALAPAADLESQGAGHSGTHRNSQGSTVQTRPWLRHGQAGLDRP